jgi:hypothetical protein
MSFSWMTNLSVLPLVARRMLDAPSELRDTQMAGIAWPIGQGEGPTLSEGSVRTGLSSVDGAGKAYHACVNPDRPLGGGGAQP